MFRTGLAIYLALVTAAGPWLCCCTVRDALAVAVPAHESAKAGCCHRHAPAKAHTHAEEPRSPAKPPLPNCPCQDEREPQAVALPDSAAAGPDVRLGGNDTDPLDLPPPSACCFAASDPAAARPPGGGTPFVTSRDLLCVFHILRC